MNIDPKISRWYIFALILSMSNDLSWVFAKPRTFKLVAVANKSSNSLFGTRTSPQYINCNNLSKCTGETSLKNTIGWSDLDNLGGCRVIIALNKGLHAHKTSRCASKTRSPHQIVTSVNKSYFKGLQIQDFWNHKQSHRQSFDTWKFKTRQK